ncbi:MAG: hypothetical protein QOD29_5107 [Alphaproteobacteria bacterium]|jgi:hypothetical protein|nr:hypothetical protein [Alphaproteobacteria bacterium]
MALLKTITGWPLPLRHRSSPGPIEVVVERDDSAAFAI